MPKKKPVQEKVKEVAEDEEMVTCPVCGKPVGITVPSCPYCGAEFEEEAIEEITEVEEKPQAKAKPAAPPAVAVEDAVDEDEMAECPVCGVMVSLSVHSCPSCGAEFEEEEIEEIVEVEEAPPAKAKASKVIPKDEEVYVEEEPVRESVKSPSGIVDLRVIGISLIILGVIGAMIAFMIDWFWTWVPPIGENLGLFVALPVVIVVVGLLVFMLIKRSSPAKRRRIPSSVPTLALSIFLFGIIALILIMLWDPINSALQDSNIGVGGAFVAILIIGVLSVFMGNRQASHRSAY